MSNYLTSGCLPAVLQFRNMRLFAGLLLAVMTVSSAAGQGKPVWARFSPLPQGFNPGEAFPVVSLPSAADGQPVSLASFRGKKLIVNIFASW